MTAAFVFATRSMCMCASIGCKIPICNLSNEPEFNEDTEGWISGKQVGYCYGCTRKLNFKRKFGEGKRVDVADAANDRREPSSDRDLETSERSVYDF